MTSRRFAGICRLTTNGCLFAAVPAIALLGCGDKSEQRIPIHGSVSYNGQPVSDGRITLVPAGNKPQPPVSGVIQSGKYDIPGVRAPTIGSYVVKIEGFRKTGRQILDLATAVPPGQPSAMIDETQPYLPAKYNSDSTLTAEVTAETKQLDFDLKP